jgi:hypothetical protein
MQIQQVQPPFIIIIMDWQHAWIISQQVLSPEVQVTVMPVSVISHLVIPMVRLQVIATMPFIMRQQLTMQPFII